MLTTQPPFLDLGDEPDTPIFSARDLGFLIEVTTAILSTLDIDQILYVVLSGVTSGEGLAFNRGLFMMADEGQRSLRTRMAVGPVNEDDAHRIWEEMAAKELRLGTLLSYYDLVKNDPITHSLTHKLSHIVLPIDRIDPMAAHSVSTDAVGIVPIETMLARCLKSKHPLSSTTLVLNCGRAADAEPVTFSQWQMVPILTPERILGVLVVDDAFSGRLSTSREKHLLVALANLAAIAVEQGRLFLRMQALAEVDGLTGLANRRTYDAAIGDMLTQARQTGRSVSLIVLDVDHFKEYNDRFGHLAGDDALRRVATVLSGHARKSDVLARYGGEEFVLLLPDTALADACSVARKLVAAVREESLVHGLSRALTISAGVATSPGGALGRDELFEQADKSVYEAKRKGRDRVECAM